MARWSDLLLDEEMPAEAMPVQEGGAGARRQPGPTVVPIPGIPQQRPAPRPQPRPQQAAPAPAAPQAPAQRWSDQVLEPDRAPQATPQAATGTPEPDATSWTGWAVQQVRGKQDPRYKDLPSLMDTGAVMIGDANVAQLTMPNDAAYADILKKSFQDGVTFTRQFKDANGYDIVGFKTGPDKPEQLAYVNKPGLDLEDVGRAATGTLPYLAVPGALGAIRRGAQAAGGVLGATVGSLPAFSSLPLVGRVVGGATGAAAISGGQDAAAYQLGSEQGPDVPKAIGAAAGGALAPLVAPAFARARQFIVERSMFDRATGKLTPKGEQVAREAGVDPAEMTADIAREFSREFAKYGNARAAAISAETGDLGIPTTLGQRTKDVGQLTHEQALRDGTYGPAAAKIMRNASPDGPPGFDQRQWDAMVNATMGEIAPGKPGMSLLLNPARNPADYDMRSIGSAIASRAEMGEEALRKAAGAEFGQVGRLEATDGAMGILPKYINATLDQLEFQPIPPKDGMPGHPWATQMLRSVEKFIAGEAPDKAAGFVNATAVKDARQFQTQLSKMRFEAADGTQDRIAANAVYNGYRNWLRAAADEEMLVALNQGNTSAAVAAGHLRTGNKLYAELQGILEAGGNQKGASIVDKVLKGADSPERVIDALFNSPDGKIKDGGIAALKSMKQLAAALPGEEGAHLVNDLKLAHWLSVIRNPAGKAEENIYNPQRMLQRLRKSSNDHESLWRELYTPDEIAMRNRLIRALENGPTFHDWTIKPNSSRSATTAGTLMTALMGKFVGPANAAAMRTAAGRYSGYGTATAMKATTQGLPYRQPSMITPGLAAGGANYNSN